MNPLALGQPAYLNGDVTTNNWVGANPASVLERNLGYGPGRLASGWWVCVLTQPLTLDDFKLSGTTLRSGGRLGKPLDSPEADERRTHVSDDIGPERAATLKRQALAQVSYSGPDRLVKVVPMLRLRKADVVPSRDYPMGGGGLQWTLIPLCRFLVALQVDETGIARTPTFAVPLGENANYDDRAKVARYLREA